ncbi:MAG: hypothetical protein KDA61_21120 [Planctomycetales bacterium]|nr:hypothetical protein [Planctomycetales bacterium]
MSDQFSDAVLEAYLDESLEASVASRVEAAVRSSPEVSHRLGVLVARRDAGVHTLGAVWRRRQIGVPTRQELGGFLLGTLDSDHEEYIRFRIEVLRCPFTLANFHDLQTQQSASAADVAPRRKRYFQSSAGLLRKGD